MLAVASVAPAWAGGVLDRVRAEGIVRCGAAERPGFASAGADGRITGLAVDLCRAVAIAVLGPQGRVGFRLYGSSRDYDAVRGGEDDLFFLSGTEIVEEKLVASILPGPTVFIEALALMVPEAAAARRLEDLSGAAVCFMIGSGAQRALEEAAEWQHVRFARLGFQEDAEMLDAYDVQRCRAVAGEATQLARMRLDGGVNHLASRLLPEPLALYPVLAATGTGDGQWAALVAWLVDALILADAPKSAWRADALPLPAAALGLREHWREEVAAALGTYGDMVRRNVGEGSALKLPPGPNAPWPTGLLLLPYAE
jgi:general L-amino acid transport system substrate-binding protein